MHEDMTGPFNHGNQILISWTNMDEYGWINGYYPRKLLIFSLSHWTRQLRCDRHNNVLKFSFGPTIRKSKCISKGNIEKHVQVPCKFSVVYFLNQTRKEASHWIRLLKQKPNDFPFVSGASIIKRIPPPHRAFQFLFWLFHFIIFHPSTWFCQAKTQNIPSGFESKKPSAPVAQPWLRWGLAVQSIAAYVERHGWCKWVQGKWYRWGGRGGSFLFYISHWMMGSWNGNL